MNNEDAFECKIKITRILQKNWKELEKYNPNIIWPVLLDLSIFNFVNYGLEKEDLLASCNELYDFYNENDENDPSHN